MWAKSWSGSAGVGDDGGMRRPRQNAGGNTASRRGMRSARIAAVYADVTGSGSPVRAITFRPVSGAQSAGTNEPGRPLQVSTADTGEVHGDQTTGRGWKTRGDRCRRRGGSRR